MNTENLSTLKIHRLTQAQYDRERAAGNIDRTAIYLTPDEDIDLTSLNNDLMLNQQTLGYTKKNLLPYPFYEENHTDHSVVWTVHDDGTVTANGTASGGNSVFFFSRTLALPQGRYTINGCPSGGALEKYVFRVSKENDSSVILASDIGNGATFTLEETTILRIYIRVYSGCTVSNLTFKPMIRFANIVNDTFEPYVEDINTRISNIRAQLSEEFYQSGFDLHRQFRVAKFAGDKTEGYYPQGMCYVNGNLVLSFVNLDGNVISLEEYSVTGTLIRQADLPLYHANSMAYNPNTNEIYVATLKYFDEDGTETYIKEIARVNYDTFTISSRKTYTTQKGEIVYVAYDKENNRMLAGTKYALYEIGNNDLVYLNELNVPSLSNSDQIVNPQDITKYQNRYYRIGSTPNYMEILDENLNPIFTKSFEQFCENVNLGEMEAISFAENGDYYILTAARNHSYKYIIGNVFKGNIYSNILTDEKNDETSINSATVVYVNSNVVTANPIGTEDRPFNNLDEAIMYMCSPNVLATRLELVQGSYEGVYICCPKSLEIRGNGSTIDGMYFAGTSTILRDVIITHNSVINSSLNYPLTLHRCPRVYLKSVTIQGATVNNAIYSHETQLTIDDVKFTNCTSNYYIYNSSAQPVICSGKSDLNIRDVNTSKGTPVSATVSLNAVNNVTNFSKGLLYNIVNKTYKYVTVMGGSANHEFSRTLLIEDLIDHDVYIDIPLSLDEKFYNVRIGLATNEAGNIYIVEFLVLNITDGTTNHATNPITITNLKFE